jgi:polyhydroxyalkanoate synthesis regulator phasin
MAAKKETSGTAAKAKKGGAKKTAAKTTAKKAKPKAQAPKGAGARAGSALDKSVEQFRESLERSVTLSRDRLQEVVDDAVQRGRMTGNDAEKMLSDLIKRGRRQTDTLLKELERLVREARKGVGGRAAPVRKQATQAARRARRKLG